jgi:hypothetical protein
MFHVCCKGVRRDGCGDGGFLKDPVEYLEDLYTRFPGGGSRGDVALVLRARGDEAAWAYWDGVSRSWRLVSGGGGSRVSVDPPSLAFSGAGGFLVLHVFSDVSWDVMADNDWLSVDVSSGTGNGEVVVTAAANEGSARSGSVNVSGGGVMQTVSVTQSAREFYLSVGAVEPVGSGTVNSDASGEYPWGSNVDLVATAGEHYAFSRWQAYVEEAWVDIGTSATMTVTVTGDLTVRAVFARSEYLVTVLSSDPSRGTVSGGGWVVAGGSTTITATPGAGSTFTGWSDGNANAERTLANVTADVTLTAIFGSTTLSVTPGSLSFDGDGGDETLTVASNTGWTVEVEYD